MKSKDRELEKKYPCVDCGKLRTKAEGGTTFTVCDECWDKSHKKPTSDVDKDRELDKKLHGIVLGCEMGSEPAISQIKALVIKSLGEEKDMTDTPWKRDNFLEDIGYNKHRAEMKEKWR